jgi:hypothetical protein
MAIIWWVMNAHKALEDFLFGLCFGMGFAIAAAVCHFLGSFLVKA